ncbi:MAG TPA: PilZ domain-containing protein [bacterium]
MRSFNKVRRYPRVSLKTLVKETSNKNVPFYYSKNICEEGIFLTTKNPLTIGTRLQLQFALPGDIFTILAVGEIVSVLQDTEHPGIGVKFIHIGEQERKIIKRYVELHVNDRAMADSEPAASAEIKNTAAGSKEIKMELSIPAEFAYKLMCDCEKQPEWQNVINIGKIAERYPDKRPKIVNFSTKLLITAKNFALHYIYNDVEKKLFWQNVKGDFAEIKGDAVFNPVDADRCAMTFTIMVNPGMRIPRQVRESIRDLTLPQTLNGFKAWAEKKFSESNKS